MPKISIILPSYNGEKYIAKSIDSILSQTETDWELIIVNDCSTDRTLEIVTGYAQNDIRIIVISNDTNKKLPASLNIGFSRAKGRHLTWTSDDNLYKKEALAVMSDYLNENPQVDMVSCDMDYIDKDGGILESHSQVCVPRHPRSALTLAYACNIGACFMYKKEIASSIGLYDEETFCAEDYDYFIRIALAGRIAFIDDNLYQYRRHDNSLTSTRKKTIRRMGRRIRNKYFDCFSMKYKLDYLDRARLAFLIGGNLRGWRCFIYFFPLACFWMRKRIVKLASVFLRPRSRRLAFCDHYAYPRLLQRKEIIP
jgi:glycosyltransferase involved in cell wall biosynthesis